jgi:hypothetical protein
MHDRRQRSLGWALALCCVIACDSKEDSELSDAALDAADTSGSGVPSLGEACEPDTQPGGFSSSEVYIEVGAPECDGHPCLVYQLDGDPSADCTTDCAEPDDVQEKVFCSCKCDGTSAGAYCNCPAGFSCEELFSAPDGGLEGSYCVRDSVL